jgi:hypothetical protein
VAVSHIAGPVACEEGLGAVADGSRGLGAEANGRTAPERAPSAGDVRAEESGGEHVPSSVILINVITVPHSRERSSFGRGPRGLTS